MSSIGFVKMSGAGNDLILIDHRDGRLAGCEREFVRAVCDRRFGVGADGVVLLEEDEEAPFRVRFFNPDGGEYGLCGNGARCVPLFAAEIGLLAGPHFRFRSASGSHTGTILNAGAVRILLPPVRGVRLGIPVKIEGRPAQIDWGDIGVPHAVLWVEDVEAVPVAAWGSYLRHHPSFGPEGTNVSFAHVCDREQMEIRTFERGVEGETWACGSGSAVAATLAHITNRVGRRVRLRVRSGETLTVHLPAPGRDAPELEGPVRRCFGGEVDPEALGLKGSGRLRA